MAGFLVTMFSAISISEDGVKKVNLTNQSSKFRLELQARHLKIKRIVYNE